MRPSSARSTMLAAAVLAAAPAVALGQVNATWTFNGDGSWSEISKWGGGAFPNGGGVATFALHPQQSASRNITLDVPVTLSQINFNSAYQWIIPATGTNAITLTGPANLAVPVSNASSPSLFPAGDLISRPIAGSSGLVKSGAGNLTLTATNTYSGGTTINGGLLRTTVGDLALGATGLGNGIKIDGGTLRISSTAMTSARDIVLGTNNGTLEMFAAATFSGVVSGTGNLTKTISGTLAFQSANSYTGSTRLVGLGSGTMIFQNAGAALSTSAITANGTIVLDNATTNSNNRLPTLSYAMQGGGLSLIGNSAAATNEVLGAVNTDTGQSFVTVTPNAAQNARLTFSGWTRSNRSTIVFRGTSLGNSAAANVGNILLTSAPTLVGGGGAAGSTNISIIPGAAGGTVATDLGTSFVTYEANGARPLATSEYVGNVAAASADSNVRVTAAEAVAAAKTVNALVIATGAGVSGAGPLTVTSGQVLQSSASTTANTVNLEFGANEGVITMTAGGTFDGVISGSAGITKAGTSTLFLRGAAKATYAGPTTITNGSISFNANVPVNAPSPFGNSSDPIILQPGSGTTSLILTGATATFSRNIIVRGNGAAVARIGTTGTSEVLTINGDIQVDHPLTMFPPSTLVPITFNGKISGSSRLQNSSGFAGLMVLNGDNDFTGGIEALATGDIWLAGHDRAFGTGTLFVEPSASTGSVSFGASGAARTLANPITFVSGNLNIPNTTPITFTGAVNLGGGNSAVSDGPYTITVPASGQATFGGMISDGGIVKAGAGKMILSGPNTYTGGTTISAGTVQIGGGGAAGTPGTGNIANSSVLIFSRSDNGGVFASAISGTGSLIQSGTGSATLTGNNTYTGLTTVSSGTLTLSPSATPPVLGSGATGANITTGRLAFNYAGGSSPAATVEALLTASHNNNGFNNTNQLRSTSADGSTGLGWVDDGVRVIVGYVYYGDSDLSGAVDLTDFTFLATNFNKTGNAKWIEGDYNYDDNVGLSDFTFLAANFNKSLPLASEPGDTLGSVVPEPGAFGVCAASLLARRRRSVRRLQRG